MMLPRQISTSERPSSSKPFASSNDAHDQGVHRQQGCSTDNTATDGIVVANDRVLYGVGEGQKYDQVKRVELSQFAFAGQSKSDDQEKVDQHGPENFFHPWDSRLHQVSPDGLPVVRPRRQNRPEMSEVYKLRQVNRQHGLSLYRGVCLST